jgi:formylglycine-generating enzyme required for sulfatase activity
MAAAFSPDGKFLLTAPEDGRAKAPISIWEAETGKPAGVLEGHNQGLFELSFSPDGKTLMSGGWEGFVRLWDFAERRKIRDIPSPANHWIRSAVFSSQGKIALGQDKVYLFEQDGTLLRTIDKYSAPYCFSPDGKLLAGTRWEEGGVTIWDVDTGEAVASWRAHDGKANGIAYSFQGNVLATAGGDGKVRLWDVKTQRQLVELSHDGEACGVAFSPDGKTLATTGYDYLVKLWDVSAVLTPNDRDTKMSKATPWPADAPPPAIAPFDSEQAKKHQEAWAKHLGVPVEKVMVLGKDKDGKDVKLSMVLIPPGEFLLGSPDDEQAKFLALAQAAGDTRSIYGIPAEGPQRSVRITKPFWLGRHEITMAQFRRFVEAANYKTVAERDGLGGFALVDHEWQQSTHFFWSSNLGFPQTESHPVSNVTWDDATAYCEWLTQQSGWPVSLPSEAQWEYACRAGTTTYFHSGNSEVGVERYAWVGPKSNGGPRPAGLLKPNAFGLYDMHGNMWEWCADWFGLDSYAKGPLDDPTGPSVGSEHVIRGGGWITYTRRCRAAHRGHYPPDKRISYLGFRVAAEIAAFEDEANGNTNPSPAIAEKP